MIELYCLKINENEIKTTNEKEYWNFFRMHRSNIKSFLNFAIKTKEEKVQNLIDSYTVRELYEMWKKKKKIEKNRLYG